MHESTSIPCPRCGAALPVEPMALSVTCVYCRLTAPVPQAIREAAVAHAARIGAAEVRIAGAERAIRTYRMSGTGWSPESAKLMAILFAVIIGVSVLAPILGTFLREDVVSAIMMFAVYGGVGYFGYRFYKLYKGSGQHAAPVQVGSVCSRCGGPLAFDAGSTRAVCHACNGVALAGKTIQLNLAAMAERRARDLDLERARAERQMYRNMAPMQRFGRIYVTISLGFIPVMLIGTLLVGGADEVIEGAIGRSAKEAQTGVMMLVGGALLAAVACGAVAIYHRYAIVPLRDAEAQLRRIAARLGGRVVRGGTTTALDWLDAHWLGPAPTELMMVQEERTRITLETAVGGFPALVVAVFAGAMTNFVGNKLHLIVAAPRARPPLGSSIAGAEVVRLGFEPRLSEDGVILARGEARPDVMNEQALGWLLTKAAAVASA